jgi:hypothetical protein
MRSEALSPVTVKVSDAFVPPYSMLAGDAAVTTRLAALIVSDPAT